MNVTARITLILVIGASLCAACQQATTPSAPDPTPILQPTEAPALNRNTEEIAVYSALFEYDFTGDTSQFLIVDQTQLPSAGLVEQQLSDFQERTPLDQELLTNFLEINQQPSALDPDMDLSQEFQLMTQEEIDELAPLDEESGWQLFDEKFPKAVGFIYLSRVGFNADLSQALVYFEQYYYDIPVRGGYLLLTRQDGEWVVESGYEWIT
jgi:hypothetical protein